MFGIQESRRHKAERIAGQAWDQLTAAVDSAYSDKSKKISSGTKEARRRANEAYTVLLTGRRRRMRWEWFAAATVAGAAAGWVATAVVHKMREGSEQVELPESLEKFANASSSF